MSRTSRQLGEFLEAHPGCMLVRVAAVKGSAPREAGAFMVVAPDAQFGTIGGGQLEFSMAQHAQKLLGDKRESDTVWVPLGPGIGQCCGGKVELTFAKLSGPMAADLLDGVRAAEAVQTPIFVFGAGHVGRALAEAMALLPVRVVVVDTRRVALEGLSIDVETKVSAMPEAEVRAAPAGACFVAVTHDHALDFLVTGEALRRGDAVYTGMIGSRTKRAQFKRWFFENGGNAEMLAALVSPIGGVIVRDKRPEIIAALTVAEIVARLGQSGCLGRIDAIGAGESIL